MFLIKDENIPSSTLNRLDQGIMLNEREESRVICLGNYLTNALNKRNYLTNALNTHRKYGN